MKLKRYPSKILLFGEYTVLFGGQALAIPYPRYSGIWKKVNFRTHDQFAALVEFLNKVNNQLKCPLDLVKFESFLENQYLFDTSIPLGVGLGSSAALTASIYDMFADPHQLGLYERKDDLALIESFYHGKSSGFDALVSLQQKTIIQTGSDITEIEKLAPVLYTYLLHTESPRNTHTLIQWFQQASGETRFLFNLERLAQESRVAINQYVHGEDASKSIHTISQLQLEFLDFLIHPGLKHLWKKSLAEGAQLLKICGAGGGGCYLLFSLDRIHDRYWNNFRIEEINFENLQIEPWAHK